ncbi:hypothetical protein FA95DRAFT_1597790 [Auriscalpium vulgare]|uniref:Uncharacterized protein n=1 Tax=Auriscalpium vulgare TaxID=40419 RepID=A0ACB8RHM6_9AGAM|nr:hypothetical protein FA95DRAFT_1597790 [Auriscalpium vulgare]
MSQASHKHKRSGSLNTFTSSLGLLESICESASVPYLRGVIRKAILIAETARNAKHNKETCYTLSSRVSGLLYDAYAELSDHGPYVEVPVGDHVDALTRSLESLNDRISRLADKGFIRRSIGHTVDGAAVDDFERKVNDLTRLFTVRRSSSVRRRLSRRRPRTQLRTDLTIGVDLKYLRDATVRKRILDASDYGQWRADRRCLQNTRRRYLNEILDWSRNPNAPSFCWLDGSAGSGKTSIAHEIAALHHDENTISASFFFHRDDPPLASSAVQLLALSLSYAPEIRTHITAVLQRMTDPRVLRTLTEQFHAAIVAPLRDYIQRHPSKRVLIILDAVDECPVALRPDLLQALREGLPRLPPRVKVLVTARPQDDIVALADGLVAKRIHVDVGPGTDDGDVLTYVTHELRNVRTARRLDGTWTDAQLARDAQALADKARGLFQWARVACTLLQDRASPRPIIRNILRAEVTGTPGDDLSALYGEALRLALPNASETRVQATYASVVGTIVYAEQPLGVTAVADLLNISESAVVRMLTDLGSVVDVEGGNARLVRAAHSSFVDYVTDATQCRDRTFFIDKAAANQTIAEGCFGVMSRMLRRDLCDTKHPYLDNSDVMPEVLALSIPDTLRYACRYGMAHAVEHLNEALVKHIDEFLRETLLEWIEAMSLMDCMDVAIPTLRSLQSFCPQMEDLVPNPSRTSMIYDAIRLLSDFGPIIAQSALHVYFSALPFTPPDSCLFQTYCTYDGIPIVNWPLTGRRAWSKVLFTVPLSSDAVERLAFSEDSANLMYAQDRGGLLPSTPGSGRSRSSYGAPSGNGNIMLSALTGRPIWKDRGLLRGPVAFTSSLLAFVEDNERLVTVDPRTGLTIRFTSSGNGDMLAPMADIVSSGTKSPRPSRGWSTRPLASTVTSIAVHRSGQIVFVGFSDGGVERWKICAYGWQRDEPELYSHGAPVLSIVSSTSFVASVCAHRLHVLDRKADWLPITKRLPEPVAGAATQEGQGKLAFASSEQGHWLAAVRAPRASSSYFGFPAFSLSVYSSKSNAEVHLNVSALCFAVTPDAAKVVTVDVSLERGYSYRLWDASLQMVH